VDIIYCNSSYDCFSSNAVQEKRKIKETGTKSWINIEVQLKSSPNKIVAARSDKKKQYLIKNRMEIYEMTKSKIYESQT
jgi:hypothetical protein